MQHTQRNRRHARLVTQSKTEIHKARTQKNTTHAINSMLCVHCIFCVHALQFFDLCHMSSVHCVAYGSMETDLKSVFIGLHAVSKLYTTHAMQWTHGLRHNQKLKYTTHTRKKHNTRNRFYLCSACVAFFVCVHCGFIYLCRMTSVHFILCVVYGSLETDL